MARVLAIANQKGGVGKTTTTLTLGASLGALDRRVLVIDLDPHVSATIHLAYYPENLTGTARDLFDFSKSDDQIWLDIIHSSTRHRFDFVPSHTRLSDLEIDLGDRTDKGLLLRKRLEYIRSSYDYILLDCPPQMSVLLINALVAADLVVIPIQTDFLALHGLKLLFGTLGTLERGLKRPVHFLALATMYDRRTSACRRVLAMMQAKLGPRLFETVINMDTKFREASAMGKVLTDLAPNSRGALEYLDFAKEIIRMEGV